MGTPGTSQAQRSAASSQPSPHAVAFSHRSGRSARVRTVEARDTAENPPFVPYRGERDALTGAPLDAAAVRRRISSSDRVDHTPRRADYEIGWRVQPEDITSRPLRLHTSKVENAPDAGDAVKGALGGHAYSRAMGDYLQSALDSQRAEARAEVFVWHKSAYGRGRARAALIARYGPTAGHQAYLAALAYATGDMDAETIARQTQHSLRWVTRMAKLARESAQPHKHEGK
ncbi:MAG TPA: hypothetical protein VE338_21235 [Ktedonobacterales bacterium]|jgi:hypothetical protein|nr:hypothetical protein [Ktedonobacterales bacterium]